MKIKSPSVHAETLGFTQTRWSGGIHGSHCDPPTLGHDRRPAFSCYPHSSSFPVPHSCCLMGSHCQKLVSALGASDESQEITTGVTPGVGGSAPALGGPQALISSLPDPSLGHLPLRPTGLPECGAEPAVTCARAMCSLSGGH